MSKKKSEKAGKEKKQSAKKSKEKAVPASPAEPGVAEAKEPKSKPRKPKEASGKKPPVAISGEAIALRAYYIAERRHKMGWHGDSTGDWVEAERQLKAEAAKKK